MALEPPVGVEPNAAGTFDRLTAMYAGQHDNDFNSAGVNRVTRLCPAACQAGVLYPSTARNIVLTLVV